MTRSLMVGADCWLALASGAALGQPVGAGCVAGGEAAPERVIEACDELLMDKATAEARLPAIFLARAEAFVRQGRLRFAIDDLSNVVGRQPDNASALFKRAELYRARGDADAAIRDFSSTIRLEPKNVAALSARAELYRTKIDRRHALADYAAVLRLDPANEAASANHKALAIEIERLGATMPLERR